MLPWRSRLAMQHFPLPTLESFSALAMAVYQSKELKFFIFATPFLPLLAVLKRYRTSSFIKEQLEFIINVNKCFFSKIDTHLDENSQTSFVDSSVLVLICIFVVLFIL